MGPNGPLVDVATVEDGKAVPRDVKPPSILDAMEAVAIFRGTSIDAEGEFCSLRHGGYLLLLSWSVSTTVGFKCIIIYIHFVMYIDTLINEAVNLVDGDGGDIVTILGVDINVIVGAKADKSNVVAVGFDSLDSFAKGHRRLLWVK